MNDTEEKKKLEKEIDDKTTGLAIIIAAILIGTLMMLWPEVFGNNRVSTILRWIFIGFGVFGIIGEMCSKDKKSNIMGVDEVAIGVVLCIPSFLGVFFHAWWWLNCILLLSLFFGLGIGSRGFLKIFYMINHNYKPEKKEVGKDVIVFITKMLGVVLVALQIVKAIMELL